MKTKDLTQISIFSALMAICSWLTITLPIAAAPFTLQTFGVFMTLLLLGGNSGLLAISVYVALGFAGLPVFANFSGGISTLFSPTGGYIFGFIAQALIYIVFLKLFGNKSVVKIIALLTGLIACYLFGTIWFVVIYSQTTGQIGFLTALSWCVFPYIIPDLLKLIFAFLLSKRISNIRKFD